MTQEKTTEFNLSEKMERYEEPINRAEIEHIVRQAHMEDYKDSNSYCVGCVERAILETIKQCKVDVKEFIRLLKENFRYRKNRHQKLDLNIIELMIDKLAGDKLK